MRRPLQNGTPLPWGDGAMQHHRRQAAGGDLCCQQVDMLGPAGHHQAVTAASDGANNVIDDLRGASPVRYQRRDDDRLKDARDIAVNVLAVSRGSRMNMQLRD